MIRLNNLRKIYQEGQPAQTVALDGVSIDIAKGEFVAVMGPSGCGKSTLLNLIGCLDTMTSGEYFLNGKAVHTMRLSQLQKFRRKNISFIFQHFALLEEYSVAENVGLPLLSERMSASKRNARINAAMEQFGILEYRKKLPRQLSGGQQQRVAIARAAVVDAPLLLADEPTGSLDQENGKIVMEYLREMNQKGTTIVMVTHDQKQAMKADRVIEMLDGRINSIRG